MEEEKMDAFINLPRGTKLLINFLPGPFGEKATFVTTSVAFSPNRPGKNLISSCYCLDKRSKNRIEI